VSQLSDWEDFWHGQSIEDQEKSVEQSIIALSRRKLKLLHEVQTINIHIEQLRNSLS
jgi:hypothetical protein